MLVVLRLRPVLAAIKFDDDTCLETHEITDVVADLALSAELEAVQLTSAELLPQATFGFGGVLSEMAGVVVHAFKDISPSRRNCGHKATIGCFLI